MSTTATLATLADSRPSADPNWWRQAAVYQIYPRSFADSNGDGLGDIKGITAKVPYLAVAGHRRRLAEPVLPVGARRRRLRRRRLPRRRPEARHPGRLRRDGRRRCTTPGIKLIVDIVPNHSSNRHEWFQEALAAPKGSAGAGAVHLPRRARARTATLPPSDWDSVFGGPAWERITESDGTPGQWYLHIFAKEQPDLNWANREVRDDFLKTLRFWSDRGVDGFRVDVAHALTKDLTEPLLVQLELTEANSGTDGSTTARTRSGTATKCTRSTPNGAQVFNEYNPPRTAVAEAWVHATRRARYASPEGLGQAFNFDLLQADFDAEEFREIITHNLAEAAADRGVLHLGVLQSRRRPARHPLRAAQGDPARARQGPGRQGLAAGRRPRRQLDVELGERRARAATLLMLAVPGSAYLYQGEELGLQEVADIPDAERQDPAFFRTKGVEKGRDGCRVPLPWTVEGTSFGFGDGGAHLPQPAWFSKYAVEAQDGTENSTLELYRKALKLRRELQAAEELEWSETGNPEVLHFSRPGGWQSVTNFGGTAVELPAGTVLISSSPLQDGKLPANSTAWLR